MTSCRDVANMYLFCILVILLQPSLLTHTHAQGVKYVAMFTDEILKHEIVS